MTIRRYQVNEYMGAENQYSVRTLTNSRCEVCACIKHTNEHNRDIRVYDRIEKEVVDVDKFLEMYDD